MTALDPDGEVRSVRAGQVVIATGGAGQMFAVTTNPNEATGDGIAMALEPGSRSPTWSSCSSIRRRSTTRPCHGRFCPRRSGDTGRC